MHCFVYFLLIMFTQQLLLAQVIRPDLNDLKKWELTNRKAEPAADGNKKTIRLNAEPGDGMMVLKSYSFDNGTIELDVKGKNVPQQSFVGIAFHVQNEKTFDAVYFRPFNFMNADTVRRSRSVQYISMPEYPWEKLRTEHPGKYENKVSPVPDPEEWFHVKIDVSGRNVKVFVNGSLKPSLEVEKLSNTTTGKIGLWVGNNSEGIFSNLVITRKKQAP